MGLSDFKRYQGNGRQQQRHDPETGDDLGFEETLFLVVMVQGGHEQNAASFAVFAFGVFEVAHLKHDREALDQEDAAEKGQQQRQGGVNGGDDTGSGHLLCGESGFGHKRKTSLNDVGGL